MGIIVCEICGAGGAEVDRIYFPSSGLMKAAGESGTDTAMVHGACCRIEVTAGNMRIIDDRIIESLQLYCSHFGQNAMPNKIGDDENA